MSATVPCHAVRTEHGVIYVPVVEPKAPDGADPSQRARHGAGVRQFCERLIAEGQLSSAEIAARARERFGGATSENSVRWYAAKMKGRLTNFTKNQVGQHLVLAHLLAQGVAAECTGRPNGSEITCRVGERQIRVRVKACFDDEVPFRVKPGRRVFEDIQEADFVALCDLRDGVSDAVIYIVPTAVLERELAANHAHWLRTKEGRSQQDPTRVLRFGGADKPDNVAYGYAKKFAEYKDAWDLLR